MADSPVLCPSPSPWCGAACPPARAPHRLPALSRLLLLGRTAHGLVVRRAGGGPFAPFVNEALYVCLSLIRTNLHLVVTTLPHLLLFIPQVLFPCSVTLYILFMGITRIHVYSPCCLCGCWGDQRLLQHHPGGREGGRAGPGSSAPAFFL